MNFIIILVGDSCENYKGYFRLSNSRLCSFTNDEIKDVRCSWNVDNNTINITIIASDKKEKLYKGKIVDEGFVIEGHLFDKWD